MAQFTAVSRFAAQDQYSRVVSKMQFGTERFARSSAASFRAIEKSASRLKGKINRLAGDIKSLVAIGGVTGLLLVGAQAIKEYDTQMASLRAITGATETQMVGFRAEAAKVAKQVGATTTDVAKGFEIVGSKLPELLKSEKGLAAVTKSAVTLRQASGFLITSEEAYTAVTGAINQFNLQASESERVMNALAAGQQAGSATINDLNASIERGAKAAFDAGVSLESFIAQAELLEPAGIRGAEAGTQMRNVWLNIQNVKGLPKIAIDTLNAAGVNMELLTDKTRSSGERLAELQKLSGVTAGFIKVFGKENVIAAKTLIEAGKNVDDFTQKITGTQKGTEQAAINTDTLSFKLDNVSNAFKNAVSATSENSVGLDLFGNVLEFVARNLDWVVGLAAGLAAVILPLVGIYKAVQGVTWLYNAALAVNAILTGKGAMSLKGNVAALKVFGKVSKIATAIQWAWNAAVSANPIGLIIAAIVAVIAVVVLLVKHWNTIKQKFQESPTWVKAALLPFIIAIGPLLILVNTIRKVVDAWDGIKRAFSEGGLAAGFKKLGGVILSALIDPLVFMLKLLAKIPGLGGKIDPLIERVQEFQAKSEGGFGVDEQLNQNQPEAINTQASQNAVQNELIQRSEQNVNVNINDRTGRASVDKGQGPVPVNVNSTTNNFE